MISWKQRQSRAAPWFLLPALALLAVFVAWPMLRAAFWSFSNADLLAPERSHAVGLSNYSSLLGDPRFRRAFGNTALFALLVVPVQTAVAFFLALWVNRPERPWRWLRGVFFVPVIVSMPVLAVLWTMLYQPAQGDQMGLVNAALGWLGLPPQAWLRDPRLALPAIAFMSVWQGLGLQMMVFLAGLQGVSRELLDAARIDGAGAGQRVRHVVIPALRNTIGFVVTVTTILASGPPASSTKRLRIAMSFCLSSPPPMMTRWPWLLATRSACSAWAMAFLSCAVMMRRSLRGACPGCCAKRLPCGSRRSGRRAPSDRTGRCRA